LKTFSKAINIGRRSSYRPVAPTGQGNVATQHLARKAILLETVMWNISWTMFDWSVFSS